MRSPTKKKVYKEVNTLKGSMEKFDPGLDEIIRDKKEPEEPSKLSGAIRKY